MELDGGRRLLGRERELEVVNSLLDAVHERGVGNLGPTRRRRR
jgi:hypothetical protein